MHLRCVPLISLVVHSLLVVSAIHLKFDEESEEVAIGTPPIQSIKPDSDISDGSDGSDDWFHHTSHTTHTTATNTKIDSYGHKLNNRQNKYQNGNQFGDILPTFSDEEVNDHVVINREFIENLNLEGLDVEKLLNNNNNNEDNNDDHNENYGNDGNDGNDEDASDSSIGERSRNNRNRLSLNSHSWHTLIELFKQKSSNAFKKRSDGPQLSIVNPLDVLRQRLLLELARRRMQENQDQINANAEILKKIGKRSVRSVRSIPQFNHISIINNSDNISHLTNRYNHLLTHYFSLKHERRSKSMNRQKVRTKQ